MFYRMAIDLFFIEFAVNDDQDANHTYDECILGMEGIIRQIRTLYPRVDIVVTYFVNPKMLAQLQEGKPTAKAAAKRFWKDIRFPGSSCQRTRPSN